MHRHYTRSSASLALLLVIAVSAGCASSGTPRTPKTSSVKITRAEIDATSASSAYDVISQLHPEWLRPSKSTMSGVLGTAQTGSTAFRTPLVLVYLDGVRLGGIEQLRSLSSSTIRSMEFVEGTRLSSVVTDIGTVAPDAAILVSTKQ